MLSGEMLDMDPIATHDAIWGPMMPSQARQRAGREILALRQDPTRPIHLDEDPGGLDVVIHPEAHVAFRPAPDLEDAHTAQAEFRARTNLVLEQLFSGRCPTLPTLLGWTEHHGIGHRFDLIHWLEAKRLSSPPPAPQARPPLAPVSLVRVLATADAAGVQPDLYRWLTARRAARSCFAQAA